MKKNYMDQDLKKLLYEWYAWKIKCCEVCDYELESGECSCIEDGEALERAEKRLITKIWEIQKYEANED